MKKTELELIENKNRLSDLLSQAVESFKIARPDRIGYAMPVYAKLNHVSASGMSRSISLKINIEGELNDITFFAARVLGDKIDAKNGGIKITGCGMDMGFALYDNLMHVMGLNCSEWQKHYRLEWI